MQPIFSASIPMISYMSKISTIKKMRGFIRVKIIKNTETDRSTPDSDFFVKMI